MFPPCSLHVPATKYNPVAHMTFEFVQDGWHAAIYLYVYVYIYNSSMYLVMFCASLDGVHAPWPDDNIWQRAICPAQTRRSYAPRGCILLREHGGNMKGTWREH